MCENDRNGEGERIECNTPSLCSLLIITIQLLFVSLFKGDDDNNDTVPLVISSPVLCDNPCVNNEDIVEAYVHKCIDSVAVSPSFVGQISSFLLVSRCWICI